MVMVTYTYELVIKNVCVCVFALIAINLIPQYVVASTKDLMCDTLLPIKASADEWKTTQPLTKITRLTYPFDIARPTKEEVCTLCSELNYLYVYDVFSYVHNYITLCVYVYICMLYIYT